MSKITEGNWILRNDKSFDGDSIVTTEHDGSNVTTCIALVNTEANARAISKVPEMIKLLKKISNDCNGDGLCYFSTHIKIEKLLSEIEGE